MEFSYVILLTCLLYGVVAHRPASSYLPSSVKSSVVAPVVSRTAGTGPSTSYIPSPKEAGQPSGVAGSIAPVNAAKSAARQIAVSSKRVAGVRPAVPASGPVVARSTVNKPNVAGAGPKPISAPIVGAARSASISRLSVPRPTVQKPTAGRGASKTISTSGVDAGHIITRGRKLSAKNVGVPAVSAHRTVGTHAPY
ncbi:hypothetical protein KR093_008026 [Drosophila rubida]|uniref:Uncharacterized protein n=1 Tax=Drosophila rubida TaxID=30044 RepID=A0AAD4PTN7_9MUSC|nr:hypothetical protein KR093_008026 [Drosophila rubida]